MIPEAICKQGKILIVDDEMANVRFLEILLQQAGYRSVHSTTDARQALPLFDKIQPDLLLLDLSMPHMDGFAVMQQLQQNTTRNLVPILVLTADATSSTKHKALQMGAQDFLTKPLDETEVLLRINNLLGTYFHGVLLEQKVQERTQDLEKAQLETLERLAIAAEYRDDDTGQHTRRVGLTAARIAASLNLPQAQTDLIRRAAPLHDVGKIGISDAILLKPGKLTESEFATMKEHTLIGGKMLSGSSSPWLQLAEEIAVSHHERWDGHGYPFQLQGEAIPLVGRIVTIADVFDALTHERPYKKAWPVAEAMAEIERQSGKQFDPQVVKAFLDSAH
ncbi:response regulator receiver modulated metal dependent phosphohydrolase [Abditibacterium utsteinense]|uniref:Response regulator receiver modulated metal dependent phosphohydrolase n=1 Tax=Abditibacterium utsteinense TaxID=1960156 RepID=A0A2S8SRC3_9BACT|nr:HD domain-containing phosphohydrolase [Abditibacterium utsteinense]PQV63335.1 response regulator receiver modulated metal dependent phosphohydrolase [Abditibacterium utsteinense]